VCFVTDVVVVVTMTGISFLESWVKFRADLITRVVGLDVGRNVFHALNRVEIVFALAAFLLTVKDIVAHSPSTPTTHHHHHPCADINSPRATLTHITPQRARHARHRRLAGPRRDRCVAVPLAAAAPRRTGSVRHPCLADGAEDRPLSCATAHFLSVVR
jgi:hypothetical protein